MIKYLNLLKIIWINLLILSHFLTADSIAIDRVDYAQAIWDSSGNLILQSSKTKLIAFSNEHGFSPIYLYGWSEAKNEWLLAGNLYHLSVM